MEWRRPRLNHIGLRVEAGNPWRGWEGATGSVQVGMATAVVATRGVVAAVMMLLVAMVVSPCAPTVGWLDRGTLTSA